MSIIKSALCAALLAALSFAILLYISPYQLSQSWPLLGASLFIWFMVFAVLLKPSTETNPERLQEYRFKVYFVYFIAFLVIIGAALLCDSMGKVQDSTSTKALSADSNANQARFGAARVLSFSEAKELRGALAISDTHGCVWAVLEDDDQLKLVRYVNAGDSALCAKSPEVN